MKTNFSTLRGGVLLICVPSLYFMFRSELDAGASPGRLALVAAAGFLLAALISIIRQFQSSRVLRRNGISQEEPYCEDHPPEVVKMIFDYRSTSMEAKFMLVVSVYLTFAVLVWRFA